MPDEQLEPASDPGPASSVASAQPIRWRAVLRFLIQWAILSAAACYLALGLVSQWAELKAHPWHIHWPYLALSFVVTSLGYWILGLGWHLGLVKLGVSAPWQWTMRAWWVGNLAKYVPGRVWILFTRIRYSADAGVSGVAAAAGFVLESLCLMVTGLLLFVLVLPAQTAVQQWHYLLCVLTIPLLAMLHPRVFNVMARLAMRLMRLPPAPFPLRLADLAGLLACFTLGWAAFGMGVALMAHSFVPFTATQAISFSGCHSFSFVAAMVSFVTPGGIAVREAILSELIKVDFPTMAVVIALASRVWITVIEVANVGVSMALTVGKRRHVVSLAEEEAAAEPQPASTS